MTTGCESRPRSDTSFSVATTITGGEQKTANPSGKKTAAAAASSKSSSACRPTEQLVRYSASAVVSCPNHRNENSGGGGFFALFKRLFTCRYFADALPNHVEDGELLMTVVSCDTHPTPSYRCKTLVKQWPRTIILDYCTLFLSFLFFFGFSFPTDSTPLGRNAADG